MIPSAFDARLDHVGTGVTRAGIDPPHLFGGRHTMSLRLQTVPEDVRDQTQLVASQIGQIVLVAVPTLRAARISSGCASQTASCRSRPRLTSAISMRRARRWSIMPRAPPSVPLIASTEKLIETEDRSRSPTESPAAATLEPWSPTSAMEPESPPIPNCA